MRVLRRRARRTRSVEVGAYSAPDLPGLASLVDRHLRGAFPQWTAGPALLARVLARPVDRIPSGESARPTSQCVLCARERGRVVGAVQLCRVPPRRSEFRVPSSTLNVELGTLNSELNPGTAHLAWIFFEPDHPEAGELLVRRAVIRAGAWRCRNMVAWELGLGGLTAMGAPGLSSAWPHLEPPLLRHGFRAAREWALWTSDSPVPCLSPPPGVSVRVEEHERGWRARALMGDASIGECRARAAASCCEHPLAAGAALIEWVEVSEPHRRRGVGAALVSAAAGAAAAGGCRLLAAALPAGDLAASHLARRLGLQLTDRLRVYTR
ncbi:MAG: GNAT family N-acetyltransferase [Armatimonadetes bacterium]|nr:GNAT family N-acetyltransferase [Armatimonadota bacterium]